MDINLYFQLRDAVGKLLNIKEQMRGLTFQPSHASWLLKERLALIELQDIFDKMQAEPKTVPQLEFGSRSRKHGRLAACIDQAYAMQAAGHDPIVFCVTEAQKDLLSVQHPTLNFTVARGIDPGFLGQDANPVKGTHCEIDRFAKQAEETRNWFETNLKGPWPKGVKND